MQHNQTNTKQPVQNSKITEAFNDITDTLQEQDLTDFIQLQKTKADSANSWSVDIADFKTKKLCKKHVVVVTDIARAPNLIHCLDDAYQLAVFGNAEAALNHMISKKQKVDIILLNNQLPDGRGMELLALLKCNPDLEHIPVVLQATFHNDVALAQLLSVDKHISDDKYDFSAVVKNVYDRRSVTLTNSCSYDGTQDNVYVIMSQGESLDFSDPISVVALETGVSTLYASKFTTRTQIDAFKAGAHAQEALKFDHYSQVAGLIHGVPVNVALDCTNWQQFHSLLICQTI